VACRLVEADCEVVHHRDRPEFDFYRDLEGALHRFERDDTGLGHGGRKRALQGKASLPALVQAKDDGQAVERAEIEKCGDRLPLSPIDLDRPLLAFFQLIDAERP
jgi:hypothetical protein